MLIGYARVSTADQNLSLQLDALKAAGCEKIFTDLASGKKENRAGLVEAMAYLREGDSLVVWKLDRLGRTMKGLVILAANLESRNVELRSLTDGIDTKTAAGRFFFNIMAALATMERELILERTMAGLAVAKSNGKVCGRKPVMTKAKKDAAFTLFKAGKTPKEVAKIIGVSLPTLYRHCPVSLREGEDLGGISD